MEPAKVVQSVVARRDVVELVGDELQALLAVVDDLAPGADDDPHIAIWTLVADAGRQVSQIALRFGEVIQAIRDEDELPPNINLIKSLVSRHRESVLLDLRQLSVGRWR